MAASGSPPTGGGLNLGVDLNTAVMVGIFGSPHGVRLSMVAGVVGPLSTVEKLRRRVAAKVAGVCVGCEEILRRLIDCVRAGVWNMMWLLRKCAGELTFES